MALLIGFALDQQVPVQKAFSGPKVLRDRLGSIDAAHLEPWTMRRLEAARRPAGNPPLPVCDGQAGSRAGDLCPGHLRRGAARLWTDASDARDLKKRIAALPGFGDMKVASLYAVLIEQLGIDLPGREDELPSHPTLGDVDSADALAAYQAAKRARKAEMRAAKG